MVNVKIIAASSTLAVGAITGIVFWMKLRGHTPAEMSLSEACDGYFGEMGKAPESESTPGSLNTCDAIREHGWEWDTPIECSPDSDSYYNLRGVFGAVDIDIENTTKYGLEEGDMDQTFGLVNYISESCSGEHRNLIETIDSVSLSSVWLNYGPCSIALAGRSLFPGLIDVNECSGNPLSKGCCSKMTGWFPKASECIVGTTPALRRQIFSNWPRDGNNWVQQACYNHDICLQRGGDFSEAYPEGSKSCGSPVVYSDAPYAGVSYGGVHGKDCDVYLADAAYYCMTTNRKCSDAVWASVSIYAAMTVSHPNSASCGCENAADCVGM